MEHIADVLRRVAHDLRSNVAAVDRQRLDALAEELSKPPPAPTHRRCPECKTPIHVDLLVCWWCGKVLGV